MRVADVCSVLGATNPVWPSRGISHGIARGFGIPTRVGDTGYALAKGANSWPSRVPPATMVLICLLVLSVLQGCARLIVSDSNASVLQPPMDVSMTIRTLDADHRFSELSPTAVAERLRALHPGEPLNILALSCGGAAGAFGAGAVAGLTVSGSRPNFAVVTGVSAGALVAPFAFLGPEWDARLLVAFTSGVDQGFLQSRGLGALFGSSVYRGAPLKALIDANVSDAMIQAVAHEADKGRLLLVATTDLATGQPVVWDLGAIARNGGQDARALFRDVLLASASVPGMFPPVIIRVQTQGSSHDEAHVDGAVTVPFFVPPALLQTPADPVDPLRHAAVYVIIDGPLGEPARTTRLTARAILSRSVGAGLSHMLLTALELTAATTQLQRATLQYSAMPAAYPPVAAFHFSADTMRPLFHYAYECAQSGRLWTAFRHTESEGGAVLFSTADAQKVPCPADDAFIGYFASR
jgi:predicted acylesterase/phospholipase RssA